MECREQMKVYEMTNDFAALSSRDHNPAEPTEKLKQLMRGRAMTQDTEDVVAERRYLLMKRGLYYRPDSNGYTGNKDKAGRFLKSDASPEHEVFAVHEDDAELWSPGCGPEVMREIAHGRIQSLSDRIDVLTQALEPFARIAELREGYNDKDDTIVCVNITAVRNARAALHQEGIATDVGR